LVPYGSHLASSRGVLVYNVLHGEKHSSKEAAMTPAHPVLIVEDDAAIRAVLAETLLDDGYQVLTAENGAEALGALARVQPCLILLDLMLPVMDGFQFRATQRLMPSLATIPVVVLSAFPANVETVAELDAAAYLSKPVRLERLVATVERYCATAD
jgi:CheY-like chemotaxis protein